MIEDTDITFESMAIPPTEWTWDIFGNGMMVASLPYESKVTWYRRLLTRIFFSSKWTKSKPIAPKEDRITNWREIIQR